MLVDLLLGSLTVAIAVGLRGCTGGSCLECPCSNCSNQPAENLYLTLSGFGSGGTGGCCSVFNGSFVLTSTPLAPWGGDTNYCQWIYDFGSDQCFSGGPRYLYIVALPGYKFDFLIKDPFGSNVLVGGTSSGSSGSPLDCQTTTPITDSVGFSPFCGTTPSLSFNF